jgi:hypothetical protein
MKRIRNCCAVIILSSTLGASAFAGQMETPKPKGCASASQTVQNISPEKTDDGGMQLSADPILELTLGFISRLLSLV